MANGWTNANNFKPWTQYELTPSGDRDIVIPKGSYLSQDIIVHGDPNYASCNIKQGTSVGDITYGSANTPIDDGGGCGVYYPKNTRTPYGIYENLINGQTTDSFNNHMVCDYGTIGNEQKIVFLQDTKYVCEIASFTEVRYSRLSNSFRAGRAYSNKVPVLSGSRVCMVCNKNTVVNGLGYIAHDYYAPSINMMFLESSYQSYTPCFLYPVDNNINTDYQGIGLVQNGNSYAVIYTQDLTNWYLYRTFFLSQSFAGVAVKDNNSLLILFNKGTVYEIPFGLTEAGKTSEPIISSTAYSMTDLCSNNESEIYAIGKNSIYRLLNNQWIQIDLYPSYGYYGACTNIDSTDINYTQWITYSADTETFEIGSSNAFFRFGISNGFLSQFTFNTNAHCWLDYNCYMYGNLLFYNNHVFQTNNSLQLTIRG